MIRQPWPWFVFSVGAYQLWTWAIGAGDAVARWLYTRRGGQYGR